MTSVLVTGANGQLGRSIRDIVVNYPGLHFTFKDKSQLNIANANEVEKAFRSSIFDYCINCAAYTNVEQAETNPELAYKINAEGVKNLALACKENRVVLVHISTDYVFDGYKNEPYNVADQPNPINEYGRSKLKGETIIQETLKNFYIVRTSWLYHKNHGKNFYKRIIEKAKAGESLRVTDAQKGCPTNASNLAVYVLNLIVQNNIAYGVLHFTDNEAMTWFDFAKKIIRNEGLHCKVEVLDSKKRFGVARRPSNSVLE
ncbi:dTDP-4-dehydrorhamnose reductase [Zobellia galactanivorans]|uniref:dTDP-4-dehydrorhamnose reductase n=1 Tax=Zobellia galactanivorans (strain DSM 12802 / CCUG 47099 / CIP 106680 / NCIMB 13871 / Dsij) TaxID=63186 RepID=UPI001C06DDE4|nr:dTDP-4-dehydrorhamnose reductase [Zobellia galactanivorans]MBU3026690.1 dTDP-4-dehydrorhamnose reductase [Zobellia galactanivorans]